MRPGPFRVYRRTTQIGFGAGARYRTGLRGPDEQLGRLLGRAALARGLGTGLGVLAIGATSVARTAVGIGALRSGQSPGPALTVLALTPLALADVVASLPEAAVRLLAARPAERLAELESTPSAVPEQPPARLVDAPRSLATRGLAVRWSDADRDAVRGVDLDLGPHPRLALVGPSGSGKSTVVAALLRTLAPSAGQVLADGRDASRCPGQTAPTLAASPGADPTRTCSTTPCAQTSRWPVRPRTTTTRGRGTPGPTGRVVRRPAGRAGHRDRAARRRRVRGRAQRIGVARALLADRPIMVFDEPTAHLDTATADALAAEILATTAGRRAVIVTQRPEQPPGLPAVHLPRASTDSAAHTLVGV